MSSGGSSPLTLHQQQALADALDDEYRSHGTDQGVVGDFGPVRPFINIVEAEARHISTQLALFAKFAVAAPVNRWTGKARRFAGVHQAGIAGVQGEIENVALYDRLPLASLAGPAPAGLPALRQRG